MVSYEIAFLSINLESWWNELEAAQQMFWGIAIVFSVLFFIQFILSLIGVGFEGDTDMDTHLETTGSDYHLDASFQLLSVRSVIAFFTFFGWAGVLMLKDGFTLFWVILAALLAGSLAMILVGYMMFWFSKLTKAANIDMNEALFTIGEVYLTIPPNRNGQGKVHIMIGRSLREMDAISEYYDAIPTGSKVRIVEVIESELLVVEPML